MSARESYLPTPLLMPARIITVLYGIFVAWASLQPGGPTAAIAHQDKILHLLVYGFFALCVALAWPKLPKIQIWLGLTFFGGAMEIAQGLLTSSRTLSVWDGLANSAGAAIILVILALIARKLSR